MQVMSAMQIKEEAAQQLTNWIKFNTSYFSAKNQLFNMLMTFLKTIFRNCSSINSILTSFPLEIACQQLVQSFHYHIYILNIYVSVASYNIITVLTS